MIKIVSRSLLVGGSNGLNGFREFIYDNIVPATFVAPMKSNFDMNDAQTILVCNYWPPSSYFLVLRESVVTYLPSMIAYRALSD